MKRNLRMKCANCGHWNRFPVNKTFVEQPSSESKVKVLVPIYEPLQVVKCKKCGKDIVKRTKRTNYRKLYLESD